READGVEEVVEQFGAVPCAGSAHVEDVGRKMREGGLYSRKGVGRASDHERQAALLGSGRSTGDARVEVLDAGLGEAGVDLLRRARRGRTEVDDDHASAERSDEGGVAE